MMMRLLRVVASLSLLFITANAFAGYSNFNFNFNSNSNFNFNFNFNFNSFRDTRSTSTVSSSSSSSTTLNGASLTLFSPCKINLFLRILRKRDDGFHDLASLFQAVGFGDTLHLEIIDQPNVNDDNNNNNKDDNDNVAQADEFTCNMPGVPLDQSNLVLRALTLMREKTGIPTYFKANLHKECPAQAGLGGGSAN